MGEKGGKEDAKRYSGVGGVAEAGGVIPWLIIKIVKSAILDHFGLFSLVTGEPSV